MTTYQTQCLLGYLGYSPGPIDGQDGPRTRAALERFHADYGSGALLTDAVSGAKSPETGTFWDEIQHFRREEFRCKCGGRYCNGFPVEPDEGMVRLADSIREHVGKPLTVNSGIRCARWNAIQGGVANSNHTKGNAVDLSGTDPAVLHNAASEIMGSSGGLGVYEWGIHVDTGKYSRWNG